MINEDGKLEKFRSDETPSKAIVNLQVDGVIYARVNILRYHESRQWFLLDPRGSEELENVRPGKPFERAFLRALMVFKPYQYFDIIDYNGVFTDLQRKDSAAKYTFENLNRLYN